MGQIFVAFSEYLSFKYIGEYFDFFRQYVLEYKNHPNLNGIKMILSNVPKAKLF